MLNPTSLLSGSVAALVGDAGLGLRISSIILIASFASSCVDCGSIANNGFLSSLLILVVLYLLFLLLLALVRLHL